MPLPDAVDDVVVVGFDDAAMLLAPEPHIPVNPDVASIPEVVDLPTSWILQTTPFLMTSTGCPALPR